jgi:hypothetical protein
MSKEIGTLSLRLDTALGSLRGTSAPLARSCSGGQERTYAAGVDDLSPIGTALLAGSAGVLVAAAFPLRTRVPRIVDDGLLAIAGAGLAVGGLLQLRDVGAASWVIAPLVAAVAAVTTVRALFADGGPFRT